MPVLTALPRNFVFIYSFFVLQCPMEALHGRRSLLHSTLSGGILGYIGFRSNLVSMPQNLYMEVLARTNGRVRGAAAVSVFYASAATFMGLFSGKRL